MYDYLAKKLFTFPESSMRRVSFLRNPGWTLYTDYPLAEEMHTGIRGSHLMTFQGGHIFFLTSERQQFLEATAEFLGS